MALQIAILGSVEPRVDETVVGVPAGKQRALFALLALHAPQPVSAESAVDALWPRGEPAEAMRNLRVTVSRLRRSLGAAGSALETVASGYRLAVEPDQIDAWRFETLIGSARAARLDGDEATARRLLDDALALWRGPALADVAFESFAQGDIARLEELRLAAVEERIDARLTAGEHLLVVAELDQLAAEHPSRERMLSLLMLALYRCGRQTDALEVYTRSRHRLDAELGLEPSSQLRSLQEAILRQDPSLEAGTDKPIRQPAPRTLGGGMPPLVHGRRGRLHGRQDDIGRIASLLAREDVQLVTLLGPGGVGKTTVALEIVARAVAEDAGTRVAVVDLASVSAPGEVANAILHTLGGTPAAGIDAGDTVAAALSGTRTLLVLDNFEQLSAAAPLVAHIVEQAPTARLVITSRAPLEIKAEHRYRLASLDLESASALFVERARARDPRFDTSETPALEIAELARRLEGMPLAIELAAAHTDVLTPGEIADQLDSVLDGLAQGPRDAPDRQRSLRATLDWSHRLLADVEAEAFARLAVFAGGCTIEAARAVTGTPLDVIERLVANSMLERTTGPDRTTRVSMLEPVREYALEQLSARPDASELADRHARWFLDLAERADVELIGRDQVAWVRRLDIEAGNIRRALRHGRRANDAELVLRLATALAEWWSDRGYWTEAARWLEWALDHLEEHADPRHVAAGWLTLAYQLSPDDSYDRILTALARAHDLYAGLGDHAGMSWCQVSLALTYHTQGEDEEARAAAERAIELAQGCDDWTIGEALRAKASIVHDDLALALDLADTAANHLERCGDLRSLARLWDDVGYIALELGALDDARDLIGRALQLYDQLEKPSDQSLTLATAGLVALESDDEETACRCFQTALEKFRSLGTHASVPEVLLGIAVIQARRGDAKGAGRLVAAATSCRSRRPATRLETRLEQTTAAAGICPASPSKSLDADLAIEAGLNALRAPRASTPHG
jgi:predicted ATPase/DNA-binding SARP family transcriptional activator